MRIMKLPLCAGAAMIALGLSAAKADLLIATAGPMTGPYASFGEQIGTPTRASVPKRHAPPIGSAGILRSAAV